MENYIEIDTDDVTNAMDFDHLEEVVRDLHGKGTPIAAIVCTMGTTDEAGAGGATSDNLLSGIGRQSLRALKRLKQRRQRR